MGKKARLEIVQLKEVFVHEKEQLTGYLFCKKKKKKGDFANS